MAYQRTDQRLTVVSFSSMEPPQADDWYEQFAQNTLEDASLQPSGPPRTEDEDFLKQYMHIDLMSNGPYIEYDNKGKFLYAQK